MKRVLLALLLVVAACSGDDGSVETPSDNTATESGASESGGADSESTDTGSETTSEGTQIFVVSGLGIDIVDLVAETQEVFVDGFDSPYSVTVAQDHLWFADAQSSLVSVNASSGDVKGTVALPGQFSGLAVTDDMAWAIAGLIGLDAQLVGVERDGMTIRGTAVPPAGTYYDLVAASGDDVWVHGGDIESVTSVSKVDPATVTVGDPVDSGVIAGSMVFGFGALWIGGTKPATSDTAPLSAIAKLDPSTGEVVDLFEISNYGAGEVVLEVAFGYLWATQSFDGMLIKFDPASGDELDRVEVGSTGGGIPYPILFTSDAIWVVNGTDSKALSFDPETLEFEHGINLPYFAGAFAFVP